MAMAGERNILARFGYTVRHDQRVEQDVYGSRIVAYNQEESEASVVNL